jgi:YD repeat-containing protein
MVESSGTTSYAYDKLNSNPSSVTYSYDSAGNRTAMTQDGTTISYDYDAADRLTAITTGAASTTLTWDNIGQLLSKGGQTYTWDAIGRLVGLTNDGTTASYTYNGDGVRVGSTVNGTTTSYLQNLASGLPDVLIETTAGIATHYVYGSGIVARIGNETSYYHADGLGSTRAMSNLAAQAATVYTYDAFGMVRVQSNNSSNPFTYTYRNGTMIRTLVDS